MRMTVAGVMGTSIYIIDLLVKVIALGVVPKNRRPSSAMAWLLAIFFIPGIGLIGYLLLGQTRLDRRRHERQRALNEEVTRYVAGLPRPPYPDSLSQVDATMIELNERLGSLPATPGNRVELIADYRGSIEAMTAAVEQAEHYVHVQFYITACDHMTEPFFDALDRATARGVGVRLLLDHLGSRGIPVWRQLVKRLDASDIDWRPLLPIDPLRGQIRRPDLRNHRKLLVVDGRVAFTGSQNLIEPGYNKPKNHKAGREWVELTARIEGPLVAALNVVFASDWDTETGELLRSELAVSSSVSVSGEPVGDVTGQIVPSGPGIDAENNLRAFTSLIYAAKSRISITSPYFVPDESLLYAVTTAARRGVAVELFVSEGKDQFMVFHAQRSYYEALLEAGVRIYLYPKPAVLHSKHFSIDDEVAVLGSSNMDMRSFALNYEVSLMLFDGDPVAQLRKVEDSYRAISRELLLEEWLARPKVAAYVDNVLRLTAALQ
ncbi:cardiolipin synthase [Nocardioides sp. NPDC087217]|uniref:cardiolipin synthase n=1 Tax=Nocardioides sp. NPDC087217 TaxID=3364335 RepID=UPI0037F824C9